LNTRHEELQKLHQQIQEDDQVKATFLYNITNRMIAPSESISGSVAALCDNYEHITLQAADKEVANIKQQSETILELLSHKFSVTVPNGSPVGTKAGKEDSHE
jgi:K+-sensing histidine kinase KdpD